MESDKPSRLYFDTYIAMIQNAPGTQMFRHFYVQSGEGRKFDALEDGENACAFFVSSVLKLFDKIHSVHGTVANTVKELEETGWEKVDNPIAGDVIIWKANAKANNHEHIGFSLGNKQAASTSSAKKEVTKHDLDFGSESRPIRSVYRMNQW
jgi:hypothetical protein